MRSKRGTLWSRDVVLSEVTDVGVVGVADVGLREVGTWYSVNELM